jgi:hypothetical protein
MVFLQVISPLRRGFRSLGLVFCFLFLSSSALAFSIPERLEYDLRWMGLKAGTACLEIKKEDGDRVRIVSTAKSADWVSVFYPVEDRVESLLETGSTMLVLNYHLRTREGRHRKDKEVIFRTEAGKAEYIDHLKDEKKEFDIPAEIYDPLSAFYRVRTMDLKVGDSVYVTVFDSKKIWNVEVPVLKKERIKTPVGTFDTIVIKPLMKSEGIFSKRGEIYIWLTDDEKRVPVKLKTKVAVGSIKAVLVGGKW